MFSKFVFGGSLLLAAVACITLLICWPLGIVRAATNEKLKPPLKVLWILAQFLFLLPASLLYMIAVDRSIFLKALGLIACLFLALLAGLAHFVPSALPLPTASAPAALSCQDALAQSEWYKGVDARTQALSDQLKQMGEKARQNATIPLSQQIIYPEMRTKLDSAEAYLLACRISRDVYIKSLNTLERKINSGSIDEAFVSSWDQALSIH